MFNLLIALGTGFLTSALLALTHLLDWYEAAVPGVLLGVVAYMVLARRTFKQLEAMLMRGANTMRSTPPRVEAGLAIMKQAYPLARWQFGIRTQIDAQVGMVLFLQREFSLAQPYLQRSYLFGHWVAGAMLAVVQYKKRDPKGMRKTMATVTRRAKSQGLAWCLYGYLLLALGERDEAIAILAQGVRSAGHDNRVREALLAAQNNRRIKMRGYAEQWYQFHLERPPMEQPQATMGRVARRGRW